MTHIKHAFITGATSGIGKATAYELAKKQYHIFINGRRLSRLLELQKELESTYKIKAYPLCFDVCNEDEVEKAIAKLKIITPQIDLLINNAGLALGLNSIENGSMDDWHTMLDTNIKGILHVTKHLLPYLKNSSIPQIINIGSIAGKETYPNGNVYCASKHAVDSLTRGMRIDLVKDNIKVTLVNPGAVETEFSIVRFKGDLNKAENVYKGFKPLTGEDIAHVIGFIVNLPAHVNINDIVIMPTQQASATVFNKRDI